MSMYLLAQDRASASCGSLQMTMYAICCRAFLRFRLGGFVQAQPQDPILSICQWHSAIVDVNGAVKIESVHRHLAFCRLQHQKLLCT
jgi:hypothetical protein